MPEPMTEQRINEAEAWFQGLYGAGVVTHTTTFAGELIAEVRRLRAAVDLARQVIEDDCGCELCCDLRDALEGKSA